MDCCVCGIGQGWWPAGIRLMIDCYNALLYQVYAVFSRDGRILDRGIRASSQSHTHRHFLKPLAQLAVLSHASL